MEKLLRAFGEVSFVIGYLEECRRLDSFSNNNLNEVLPRLRNVQRDIREKV